MHKNHVDLLSTMFHLGGVTAGAYSQLNPPVIFSSMIIFNTLKKAEHYVKHKNATRADDPYYFDETFDFYSIRNNKVLYVSGWRCGCGCDRGSTSARVIGRIKTIK